MKRFAPRLLLAAALLWSATLQAAILTFTASLDGAQEVPPKVTPGTGTAQVVIDTILMTMAVHVEYENLLGPTVLAAHIHCCAPVGVNAPVSVGLTGFPTTTSGVYDQQFVLADLGLVQNMLNGLTYINIHTPTFPGGEIRGQLVPEPATVLLLGIAALAALGARRRA